ncbi:hypothetical protein LJB42_001694 [Komagataella kurtzmanii]|nr:hypothetical protein LJB42_001694 [Komagataella kurtzmanii]
MSMDGIGKKLGNLSLYEVKAYVRKAQNAVLNLSEMEAKVREATNNEPWGTSASLMNEIAQGTYNYRERSEIANIIFRRFTEKGANEWRQIYKALQLMEYLIKHGSERFVDDARGNISLVTMLRNFQYIDSRGVDRGVNVRNRAKNLAKLLKDESAIRTERKKARESAKKFGAVTNVPSSKKYDSGSSGRHSGSSFSTSGGLGRSHGISISADDDLDESDFGRRSVDAGHSGTRDHEDFEEYDIEDGSHGHTQSHTSRTAHAQPTTASTNYNAQPDLLGDDNDILKKSDDEDEFDAFQSSAAQTQPALTSSAQSNNLADLLGGQSGQLFSSTYATTQTSTPTYSTPSAVPGSFPSAQVNVSNGISKPKADAFSSLLSNARSKKISQKPQPTATKSAANDDDSFGAFTSEAPKKPSTPQQANNGEVDLLSF